MHYFLGKGREYPQNPLQTVKKKNSTKYQDIQRQQSEKFKMDFDNLFDIAHADALKRIKIEEYKMFSHRQREPGRLGCLAG